MSEIHTYTEWKKIGYRQYITWPFHIFIYMEKYTFLDVFMDEIDSWMKYTMLIYFSGWWYYEWFNLS